MTRYYRLSLNDEFLIVSVPFRNPGPQSLAFVRSVCLSGVDVLEIDFNSFIKYRLRYFTSYRIGALLFCVGSCFPVQRYKFFKKSFMNRYVGSDELHPDFYLSASALQEVL